MKKQKTSKDFRVGTRVIHKNHGAGKVTAWGMGDDSAVIVKFDVRPEGCLQEMRVSVNMLTKE